MRSSILRAVSALTAVAAGLGISSASQGAEPPPGRAERIMSPGRTVASDDSVEAITLNPANLGFLPAPEFRWTGVRCPDTAKVACGHAFGIGTPLLFGASVAARVDYVTPPWTAGAPFNGVDYTWITLGLGWKLGEGAAFGASLQHSYSTNPLVDGLWGVTAGLSLRPNPYFAVAAVAQDFNGPSVQPLIGASGPVLDRSYVLGLAFRPTGRRWLELGAEMTYLEGTEQVLPRGLLGVDIPYVGRFRGDIELAHLTSDERRSLIATLGLEVAYRGASLGGGILAGSGLGPTQNVGEYATAALAGYSSPGLPHPERAVSIRIEATPGPRTHVALLRRLWHIAEERDVKAVALVLRAEPADSLAHAEELADAIRVLKAHGKRVLCSWEDAGSRSLYVCANADRIVLNPAGGLRYAGLRSQYIYLASLLEKIGVKAEFVRIGAHKSAPEQFTNTGASDVARADHEDMLREAEASFVGDVAAGRKLSVDAVRAATARGPFVAQEARDAGFVDGFAHDDEIERVVGELVGHPMVLEPYAEETEAPSAIGPRDKVAILYADGDIVDGRSSHIPLLDMKLLGSYSFADTVKALRDDVTVRSVVLRIESPGGSSMASDVMWRELLLLAKKKPLIVSMGAVAASGGYYIAVPAKTIYALPLTVTGSIGIFYGKADASALLAKLGVNVETYKTTPRADAESLFRGFSDDERHELDHKVHQFYDVFLDRVSQGRHLTKEQVDAVGQGKVWTGRQALEHHLVDKLGGLREALAEARSLAGLSDDAPIVELPGIEKSLLERALDLVGFSQAGAFAIDGLPVQVKDLARAIAPMAVFTGDVPLAHMESVPLGDPAATDP